MKVTLFSLVLLVQTALSQFISPSNELPRDTLATIGAQVITGKDFLERFELMPWPKKDFKSRLEFTKLEFLYSLVAEKLMAMEATAQGIGFDSASLEMQYSLERMFVRDELYRSEVKPNIIISAEEINSGMRKFAYEMEVEVLGILSKSEGELLYKKFKQSKNKKKTLTFFKDSLYVPLDTIQISFGSVDPALEEAAYAIDKDSLSKPVESKILGWVMLRLLKKYTNPQYARLSGPDQIHKVKNIISDRKEDSLAVKTFTSVTVPQRAEANPEIFFKLADEMFTILKSDSNSFRTKNVFYFPATYFDTLEQRLKNDLRQPFISISDSVPMTLQQVLMGLKNNYVVFPYVKIEYIRWVLNNNIKTVIQNELLAREGLRKNLQQSENVRHDLSVWMDNRKSRLLLQKVIDTVRVSKDEVEEEYRKNPGLYGAAVLVNLREILVDSVNLAQELKERISKGDNFEKLARQYSKRKEWTKNGGVSGFVNINQLGELGIFASTAVVGELNGPWKIKEGFTIFIVLDRKVVDDSLRANFSEVERKIETNLLVKKRQAVLDRYIGALAKKYGVTMNEANLKNTPATTHSMFTWRHIGFGGRIMAVPTVFRQFDWVYEWLKQEHLNQ
jgi:peptidyl-prolyl cis-trans isomerase C